MCVCATDLALDLGGYQHHLSHHELYNPLKIRWPSPMKFMAGWGLTFQAPKRVQH